MPVHEAWLGEQHSAEPTVRRLERQQAAARHEAALLTRAHFAGNRAAGRDYAQRIEHDLHEERRQLLDRRAALYESPGYRYRNWAGRTDTSYDRNAWRRGRLVPKGIRHADDRRNAVTWAEILDREAQELGTTPDQLIREAERARKEQQALREATLEHRQRVLDIRTVTKALRGGDEGMLRRVKLLYEDDPETPEIEETHFG